MGNRFLPASLLVVLVGCSSSSQPAARQTLSDAASHDMMVQALGILAKDASAHNIYVGQNLLRQARAQYATRPPSASIARHFELMYQLAKLELNHGHEQRAIALFVEAEKLLKVPGSTIAEERAATFLFDMGMAYLRLGESQNCCAQNTPESCILPIQGAGVHSDRTASTRAIAFFRSVLTRTDEEAPLHLSARWLTNLAYMTLGEYPHGVPEQYLVPLDAIATTDGAASVPRFENVASKLGVDTFSLAGGAVADDFNNDGWIDLVVSSWDPSERLRLFWNRQGKFVEAGKEANLVGITGGLNMVQADYNNDGHTDILVLRGGWLAERGGHPNSLLKNKGDETFTDVTFAALGNEHYPTQTAAWIDFNRDGHLDLYIGNETSPRVDAPCQLFKNNGDSTFTDIASAAGVTNDRLAKAVTCGDFDSDGWPDIYVSNYRGANRLYRNQGDETFVDVAQRMGVDGPDESFTTWFWDYDNDGDQDLYVAAYYGGVAEVAAYLLELPFDKSKAVAKWYRNDGGGGFTDVAAEMQLSMPHHPMGANFGDLNNDGWLDFYLGTGWPELHEITPNAMYLSERGRQFTSVTLRGGFGHLQKGHAVVFADFDNDGDQDVFEQLGGFVPVDRYYDAYFENPGADGKWIRLKLVGTDSNRSAIGARIRVDVIEQGKRRSIHSVIGSGGSFGANPLVQNIGLGQADEIVRVEIRWPSTLIQTVDSVSLNTRLQLEEANTITQSEQDRSPR